MALPWGIMGPQARHGRYMDATWTLALSMFDVTRRSLLAKPIELADERRRGECPSETGFSFREKPWCPRTGGTQERIRPLSRWWEPNGVLSRPKKDRSKKDIREKKKNNKGPNAFCQCQEF